jgi:glutathione-independent formaldehyde dehydrogenase
MHAVVYKEPYHVDVEDVADPRIEHPLDVIVQITSTNICGSDLHMYEGRTDVEPGTVFGHENMGVVVARGDAVNRIEIGDRVSVPFPIACGTCENCERGWTAYCLRTNPNPEWAGAAYGYADMGPYRGGQADYLRVPFGDFNLLRLPPGDEYELDFALLSDVFPTGYHGTELAGVEAGDTVVVFGAGPVGMMAAYSAVLRGAAKVMIVDPVASRLQLGQQIGVIGINPSTEDVVRRVKAETGGLGAHRGIDAVGYQARSASGEERPELVLNQLVACVRWTGSIGVIGVYFTRDPGAPDEDAKRGRIPFDMGAFFTKGLRMGGSQANVKKYNRRLRDLIIAGQAKPSFLVSHRLPLVDAPDAYRHYDRREEGWTKVVLQP